MCFRICIMHSCYHNGICLAKKRIDTAPIFVIFQFHHSFLQHGSIHSLYAKRVTTGNVRLGRRAPLREKIPKSLDTFARVRFSLRSVPDEQLVHDKENYRRAYANPVWKFYHKQRVRFRIRTWHHHAPGKFQLPHDRADRSPVFPVYQKGYPSRLLFISP